MIFCFSVPILLDTALSSEQVCSLFADRVLAFSPARGSVLAISGVTSPGHCLVPDCPCHESQWWTRSGLVAVQRAFGGQFLRRDAGADIVQAGLHSQGNL